MYYAIYKILNNPNNNFSNNLDLILTNMDSKSSNIQECKSSVSMNSTWQYYFKGAIAGMTGILLSHPIDTVKTHIQTGNIMRNFTPSIRNLYKGLIPPLIGVGLEKAIVFGTYNYVNKNINNISLSGAIAGFSAAVIVSPYERLKILRQNNIGINRQELSLKFLFRGLGATWTREVPGFAIYFSVYEWLKHTNHTQHGKKIALHNSFIYGGISGFSAWVFIYPQDRIKTILQSNNSNQGFTNVMKDIYSKGGMRYFYSGFSWAVARAMLLHSGTFCMMEFLTKYF